MDHDHSHTEHGSADDDDGIGFYDFLAQHKQLAHIVVPRGHEHNDVVDVDHDDIVHLTDLIGAAVVRVLGHHHHGDADDHVTVLVDLDDDALEQLAADVTATVVHDLIETIFAVEHIVNDVDLGALDAAVAAFNKHFPAPAPGGEVSDDAPVIDKPEVW